MTTASRVLRGRSCPRCQGSILAEEEPGGWLRLSCMNCGRELYYGRKAT